MLLGTGKGALQREQYWLDTALQTRSLLVRSFSRSCCTPKHSSVSLHPKRRANVHSNTVITHRKDVKKSLTVVALSTAAAPPAMAVLVAFRAAPVTLATTPAALMRAPTVSFTAAAPAEAMGVVVTLTPAGATIGMTGTTGTTMAPVVLLGAVPLAVVVG